MKRYVFLFLLFITNVLFTVEGEERLPKVLMLIIASDQEEVWRGLQEQWRQYMNEDPEHIEAYFIKANPRLKKPYKIEENVIWTKTKEKFIPGILNKTVVALDAFAPRLHEFDYVIRTNLSSFYIFPRLLKFLQTQPKTRCYSGPIHDYYGLSFVSGAGMIFSSDVAATLVKHKKELFNYKTTVNDDVVLGDFFKNKLHIPHLSAHMESIADREAWEMIKDDIPPTIFHLRLKNNSAELRRTDELYVYKELVDMFYN